MLVSKHDVDFALSGGAQARVGREVGHRDGDRSAGLRNVWRWGAQDALMRGRMRSRDASWGSGASVAGSTMYSDETQAEEPLRAWGNGAFSGAGRRRLWGAHRTSRQGQVDEGAERHARRSAGLCTAVTLFLVRFGRI